jgi:hypothetical protein
MSLAQGNNVLFFDNRLQFLVSATVITRPVILIDTLVSDGRDVRWLYAKFVSRGLSSRINYITPLQVTENRYLKGFSLITNMAQLKLLCPPPKGGKGIAPDMRPEPIIASHVEKLLRKSELDFLTGFYVPETMQFRARTKSEASRLYYIRRKLNFESSSELKQLMLYLSHHKAISAQTQKERTDDRLVRAAWPILRTLVTL